MHIRLLISAAAIALVAGLGTASASENYATLDGIPAVSMSTVELSSTRGGQQTGVAGIPALLPMMDRDFGVGCVMLIPNASTSDIIVNYPADSVVGDHINVLNFVR